MNIFYLDHNVTTCAKYHVDKHCVKMILEYAQLLSTAHHVLDGELACADLYKATHINHPSAVWVRQSDANYAWLVGLFAALLAEYTHRYGKNHACERMIDLLSNTPRHIPRGSFTEPPCCMPDECKNSSTIKSYRNYYLMSKSHIFAWKNRAQPLWINSNKCCVV
jgi:hypothetical protein